MAGVVAMRHDRRTPKTPDRSLMRARGLLRSCPSRSPTPPHPPRAFACAQKPARCLSSTSPTRAADTLDACLHVARLPRFCRLRAPPARSHALAHAQGTLRATSPVECVCAAAGLLRGLRAMPQR